MGQPITIILYHLSQPMPQFKPSAKLVRWLTGALMSLGLSIGTTGAAPIDVSQVRPDIQVSALPEGWEHGAFMEIFVRSWRDSDGDGIGDLRGLTQSLAGLQKLGIRGIWLMPITRNADGDHGYATTDYRNIDPAYGTLDDFDALVREAHARGIGIIMDYVINHSAKEHPAFAASMIEPQGRLRHWYEWRTEHPQGWDIWGRDPWIKTSNGSYLATFGASMPDFNLRNPEVVAYHQNNLRFWLNRGIDGFRLDAVPHLIENSAKEWNDQPESRQLAGDFARLIKAYPGRYVVCEATAEPRAYANAEICGGSFAFGLQEQIVHAAKGDVQAIRKLVNYFSDAPHTLATFISNHDQFAGERLWDQVAGDLQAYRLAAASYLLLPGTPFIYYGEHIGMAGSQGLRGDEKIRGPLSWTSDNRTAGFSTRAPYRALSSNVQEHNLDNEERSNDSIWSFYRDMLTLRNTRISLSRGTYELAQAQGKALIYQRRFGTEHSVVIINFDAQNQPVRIEGVLPGTEIRRLYPLPAAGLTLTQEINVPARSVAVFALERP